MSYVVQTNSKNLLMKRSCLFFQFV
jgi:hypothetical protein